jgi:hypothetical protein
MGVLLFDQYTYLHLAIGVILYFIGLSLPITIILHIIFEIIENTEGGIFFINKYLAWIWPGGKSYPDSPINRVGDTIGVVIGWISAKYMDDIGRERRYVG